MNKRILAVVLACSATLVAMPSLLLAGPVSNVGDLYQTSGNQITQFKITNFEQVVHADGTALSLNETIVAGDRFQGIINVTTSQTTSGTNSLQPSGFQLTGVFDVTVDSVAGSGDSASFKLVPTASFASTLAGLSNVNAAGGTSSNLANTMIAMFVGNTVNFTDQGTIASSIAYAESGTFYAGIGATGSWGNGYYWQAVGPDTEAGNADITTSFTATLGMIFNNPGLSFISDQHVGPSAGANNFGFTSTQLNSILNQVTLKGSSFTNADYPGTSQWPLQSQDPVQVHAVPEPGSLGIWGLMAASLFVVRRRRVS